MSKKRAYIRKRRSVHLRCRQKAENARKVRSRQKPVQSPESASVTFQAAATLWHRTNVARYKGATAVKYENLLRSHILPELGARQLEEINTLLLADFMNAKLHCGRLDHSGGLSSSYVRSMMLLVLDIMEFAAAEGLCPPVKTTLQTPAANRREVVILDTDALRRLETYLLAKPDITGTGILISLHTGLRISEVCALRWEDIDFRKAVLHVRSTVARVRGTDGGTATRLIIDTPKTKSSLRDIPLSRQLMAVLLPLYEKRRSEYVISDKSGFVSPRTYEYRFHRVLDRCGLPSINYNSSELNVPPLINERPSSLDSLRVIILKDQWAIFKVDSATRKEVESYYKKSKAANRELDTMAYIEGKLAERGIKVVPVENGDYPDMFFGDTALNATYMLCSDGFRHEITEREIYAYLNPTVMTDADGMQRNMEALIELNKQRRERDNISVVTIRTF